MELKMNDEDFIVSKTDLKGRITYGNKIFIKMSGYSEDELLNKPHNIIRHQDMPKCVFKLLWDYVQNKKEIFAYVVNKAKNGDYYWVYTNVTPSMDTNGNIIGYYSVRRKPNPKALEIIKPLYQQLLEAERTGGAEASTQMLMNILSEKGATYDEFIISIQE